MVVEVKHLIVDRASIVESCERVIEDFIKSRHLSLAAEVKRLIHRSPSYPPRE
jgi:hypothetical protein